MPHVHSVINILQQTKLYLWVCILSFQSVGAGKGGNGYNRSYFSVCFIHSHSYQNLLLSSVTSLSFIASKKLLYWVDRKSVWAFKDFLLSCESEIQKVNKNMLKMPMIELTRLTCYVEQYNIIVWDWNNINNIYEIGSHKQYFFGAVLHSQVSMYNYTTYLCTQLS